MKEVKYNPEADIVYIIDLSDLINQKVDSLSDCFNIIIQPFQINSLYNTQPFILNCYYTIKKIADSFLMNLKIDCSIPTICDICGVTFNFPFRFQVQEIFTSYFEYTNKFDDMYYFISNDDKIDVGKICIENFISNLPITYRCSNC
ncbi:MAG: YceD family protein [bacterium]